MAIPQMIAKLTGHTRTRARLATIALGMLLCLPSVTRSQPESFRRENSPFPVQIDGSFPAEPFLGGFNSPKPSLVYFNRDALIDLAIGDPGGRLMLFENVGSARQPKWRMLTNALGGINIGTWHVLTDIDADHDLDLFCDNRLGQAQFWRNESDGYTIIYTLVDTAFSNFNTAANSTPAFVDLDTDGDLDYFFGTLSGTLEYWRNDGTPVLPLFTFMTETYDDIIAFPGGGGVAASNRHGLSTIAFADIDSDTDQDLLFGDILNPGIYLFANLGTPQVSDLTWQTDSFGGISTTGFNHPRFGDIDSDGDLDMIVGLANGDELDNLPLYRNTGTPQSPQFILESANLIATIDVGSGAMPTGGDLDADGDADVLAGGTSGTLWHFENIGTPTAPSLVLRTRAYQNIDVGQFSAPHLVDWDKDGDFDLLIGNQAGRIEHWRNDGTLYSASFVLATNQLGGIKVDQLAIPATGDWNNDTWPDLVVGEWDFNGFANLLLYRREIPPAVPELTQITNRALPHLRRDFTLPTVIDWDTDGRLDLLLGTRVRNYDWYRFEGAAGQFPDSLTLVKQTITMPGTDDGTQMSILPIDIDVDGDRDLIIGEEDGGLNFYRGGASCCVSLKGNVDGDPLDLTDPSDLQAFVDHLFFSRSLAPCFDEADLVVDALNQIDAVDILRLVDYIFFALPLPACP